MKKLFIIFFSSILILLMSGTEYCAPEMRVYYFDVGQAESEYIELPDGRNMLIDAGNDADGPLIVRHLRGIGIEKIDFLIATHPHEDHIGGMDDVISNFEIGTLYTVKLFDDDIPKTECYESLIASAKLSGCNSENISGGMNIIDNGRLKLDCLSPDGKNYDDLNSYSAVMRLEYGSNVFLFMGDSLYMNEISMIGHGYDLDCDVLNVGHHGSATSSSMQFLRLATPQFAVISVGAINSYGHPTPSVLRRLESCNAVCYRTDKDGTCVASSDGQRVTMYKYNICLDGDRI